MHEFSPDEPKTHKKKQSKNSWIKPAAIVGCAVIGLSLSFMGGVQYQKGKAPRATMTNGQTATTFSTNDTPGGGRRMMRNGTGGSVTAVSNTSITVSGPEGDKTFTINSDTSVTNDGASAAVGDIKVGDTVLVTVESTGSTTAKRIMLNPNMMMGSSQQAPTATTN